MLFVDCDTIPFMKGLRLKHKTWIWISALLWAVVGLLLLVKGGQLFAQEIDVTNSNRAFWVIWVGFFLGFLKARFILRKTVQRISLRLLSLPSPVSISDAYPKSYWILLASMMSLGFLLRLVPFEVRGFIDIVVGSALLNGATLYVREARTLSLPQQD